MTVKNKNLSFGLWVTALLCAATLVLCFIMMSHSLNGSEMRGCTAGSSCDSVLSSRWAMIFNVIPVSAIAAGIYLAVMFCCVFINISGDAETKKLAWKVILVLSGAIIGSAVWLLIVQLLILDKFCPYCITTNSLGVLTSGLIIFLYLKRYSFFREFRKGAEKNFVICILIGFGLAIAMASIQMLSSENSKFSTGVVNNELPAIDVNDAPVIGDPEADYVVTMMFDYQCSHCRKIHRIAKEIVNRLDGQLALVLCPTPLSPECNRYMTMTEKDLFAGSCDLTRLALAVWRCNKSAFHKFDSWLFYDSDLGGKWVPRTVAEARIEAERLVGADALDAALSDFWIMEYMNVCFNLFGRTTSSRSGGIPRLIYDSKWMIPDAVNADEMSEILKKAFNIPE